MRCFSIFAVVFVAVLGSCTDKTLSKGTTKNLTPYFGKLQTVAITEIEPQGWLKQYLVNQKNGLTGNLESAGYPFNSAGWGTQVKDSSSWWPYEQTGYWIDGMITTGHLLKDTALLSKARNKIFPVLENTDKDHFIGPKYLRKKNNKHRWVHTVYFRGLMQEYMATGNELILEKIHKFYQNQPEDFFYEVRDMTNIENLLWAYTKTGDSALKNKAINIYKKLNDQDLLERPVTASSFLDMQPVYEHGVTYNEAAKLGAILFMNTGNDEYLLPSIAAYHKINEYYMMVDGVNVSSEHLRTPVHSLQTHETCDIADMTWSMGYLLMATGGAEYADQIEKAIFNAAPGAVSKDFKALQYLSGPNQVVLDSTSNHNKFFKGNSAMMFGPNQFTECCPANVNRIMPNYVSRMWMKDADDGVVAAMYGPSKWTGFIKNTPVSITQKTRYPFSNTIEFEFNMEHEASFPFSFRIPRWCTEAKVAINGVASDKKYSPEKYYSINRVFQNGDHITVTLPQKIKLSQWPNNGVAVERGPLVYSLKMDEQWQALPPDTINPKSTETFPAYIVTTTSPWNYALDLENSNLEEQVEIIFHDWNDNPWSTKTAPISIKVPAKQIPSWKIIEKDTVLYAMNTPVQKNGKTVWREKSDFQKKGDFRFTPALPSPELLTKTDSVVHITLIPYGSAKLRVTIFPSNLAH